MELVGFAFGFLGYATAALIFDPSSRSSSDVKITVVANAIAVMFWTLFAVVRKRTKDPAQRQNVLIYSIVLPMIIYVSGFGYGVWTARR